MHRQRPSYNSNDTDEVASHATPTPQEDATTGRESSQGSKPDRQSSDEVAEERSPSKRQGSKRSSRLGLNELSPLEMLSAPIKGFAMEDMAAYEEHDEQSFMWEDIANNGGSVEMGGDESSTMQHKQAAATLQRRLQAMGDLAERELKSSQRQLSPINREVFGQRPLLASLPERRAVSAKDPLAEALQRKAAEKVKFRLWAAPMPGGERRHTARPTKSCLPTSDDAGGCPRSRLPTKSSWKSFSPSTSMVRDTSAESLVVESASSSCAEWYGSNKFSAMGSTACTARSREASPRLPPAAEVLPIAQLDGDASGVLAVSDPLTLVMMYRRMLLQETNNGLMGGTPFTSQPAPQLLSPGSSRGFSRQGGQWKGLSRGVTPLTPLISRTR